MKVFRSFYDLPIRYKLLVSYSAVYILAITLGSVIIYSLVRTTIEHNIESMLQNSTFTIHNMVKTSVEVSIKNHLRAAAEKNREIVTYFHGMFREGLMSEEEAKRQVASVLLSQRIGDTGYIYCIDSNGTVLVHPKKELITRNVSDFEFVREQMARKEGYVEYDWMNPGETVSRPKALYMTYFAPWDWIISASSYRSEFKTLVNVEDFRDSILALRFGETGYSFVIDSKGNLVLHPKLEGNNYFDVTDAQGRAFIKEICEQKNGKIAYSWMNPGETLARTKLAIINYIPDLDWIVASSSYLDEFYGPLYSVRNLFIAMVIVSLLLVLTLTVQISSAITNPLQELMNRFKSDVPGDFSGRVDKQSGDEIGQLASYFNLFMEKLEHYNEKLQGEIIERKQAEEKLRLSQELFSKAFKSSPNGICIFSTKNGRFIDVNDTLLVSTGYCRDEVVDRAATDTTIFGDELKARRLIDSIAIDKQEHVQNLEIEILTKSGETRLGILSTEPIEIRDEKCMLLTIEDVTDRKHLERAILEIGDRERQRIGQDLHDDLCPHLIGIEVLSEVLNRKLDEESSKKAAHASMIRTLVSEAIVKTRRLARGLCPVHLVAYGLESALKELCINVREVFNMGCELRCKDNVLIHDNTVATHLFYIAQEAVQNAIRHGAAERITVELSSNDGIITLRVADDGRGMQDSLPTKGMGLRIMNHRAKMIGGSFEIKRVPEGGTIVECRARDTMNGETAYGKAQG